MALTRVRYTGLSDVRIMSVEDLAKIGVTVDADLTWDHRPGGNKASGVLIENPSERLLYQFTLEGAFTVTEVNEGAPDGVPIVTGHPDVDDTGSVVRDATTGQGSSKDGPQVEVDPNKAQDAIDAAASAAATQRAKDKAAVDKTK